MCSRKWEGKDLSGDEDWGKRETKKERKTFCAAKPIPLRKKYLKLEIILILF